MTTFERQTNYNLGAAGEERGAEQAQRADCRGVQQQARGRPVTISNHLKKGSNTSNTSHPPLISMGPENF